MYGIPLAGLWDNEERPLSRSEIEYKTRVALDRENRLNKEELRVYNDTLIELEYGSGFFQRAHP